MSETAANTKAAADRQRRGSEGGGGRAHHRRPRLGWPAGAVRRGAHGVPGRACGDATTGHHQHGAGIRRQEAPAGRRGRAAARGGDSAVTCGGGLPAGSASGCGESKLRRRQVEGSGPRPLAAAARPPRQGGLRRQRSGGGGGLNSTRVRLVQPPAPWARKDRLAASRGARVGRHRCRRAWRRGSGGGGGKGRHRGANHILRPLGCQSRRAQPSLFLRTAPVMPRQDVGAADTPLMGWQLCGCWAGQVATPQRWASQRHCKATTPAPNPGTLRPRRCKRRGGGVASPTPRGAGKPHRLRVGWRRLGRRARWVMPGRQRERWRQGRAARPRPRFVVRRPSSCAQLEEGAAPPRRVNLGRRAGASNGRGRRRDGCCFLRARRQQELRARRRRGCRRRQRLGGGDSASVPRRGRPPSGDGGATAAVAGGKVAGCTGGAAAAGVAAPTRPPDEVGRLLAIDRH